MTERLHREHQYQLDLLLKEREGDQKLSEQTIQSLESKLLVQEKLLKEMGEKTNRSLTQVQDIALKAIEGASAHYSREKHSMVPKEVV